MRKTIMLFAGTTEGRKLCDILQERTVTLMYM